MDLKTLQAGATNLIRTQSRMDGSRHQPKHTRTVTMRASRRNLITLIRIKPAALETNHMTNLLPQISSFIRTGAWRETEKLVECYRDEPMAPLQILAGPIYGDDQSTDIYSISHGLHQTPDYYWKVVYSPGMEQYDAWIMPNLKSATKDKWRSYRRSIDAIIAAMQGAEYYKPVINRLKAIQGAAQVELKNKSIWLF